MDAYRKKNSDALESLVKSKKSDLEKLSQDIMKGKEKNFNKLGELRREIARISTVINEKSVEVK